MGLDFLKSHLLAHDGGSLIFNPLVVWDMIRIVWIRVSVMAANLNLIDALSGLRSWKFKSLV